MIIIPESLVATGANVYDPGFFRELRVVMTANFQFIHFTNKVPQD